MQHSRLLALTTGAMRDRLRFHEEGSVSKLALSTEALPTPRLVCRFLNDFVLYLVSVFVHGKGTVSGGREFRGGGKRVMRELS